MSRITITVLTLCAGLAACSVAKPLETVRGEPPCRDYISGIGAIGVAKQYASRLNVEVAGHEVRAIWNDAEWNILAFVPDGPHATVTISADGQVMQCRGQRACVAPKGTTATRCKALASSRISEATATRIALDYLSHQGTAYDATGTSADWWAAHWAVWFVPEGPAPVDSDFKIIVSPDGLEMELIPALGMPSPDGFLFRDPN